MEFALVIPCYNFASGLGRSFERIAEWRRVKAPGCRVYFVNDGSTDDTSKLLSDFAKSNADWCEAIDLPKNQGKGAAVRTGFLAAQKRCSKVVFTDCDIHYGLDLIIDRILPGLEDNDVVITDRSWVDESRAQTFVRHMASGLFSRAVGTLTGVLFHDTQAGLKGYRADSCLPLFELQQINSFSFDVEILSIAVYYRLRILQLPIMFSESYKFPESSTIRLVRTSLKMFGDLVRINLNWKRGRYASSALASRIDRQIYRIN